MKRRLTAKSVKALKASPGRRVVVWDPDLPGFGVVVHNLGAKGTRKTFVARYGSGARRRWYTIGPWGEWTAKDARAEAADVLNSARKGGDPLADRDKAKGVPTFGVWVDGYLAVVAMRKKSAADDKHYLGLARKRWAGRPLDKIATEDVRKLVESIAKEGKKTAANRCLASVRACLAAAWRDDLIPSNPAMKVKALPEPAPRSRVLDDDELTRLVAAVDAHTHPHERAAFVLLLSTGARLSEVLRARWADIDLAAAEWRLPSPKAGHPQLIPLPKSAITMLRDLPRVGSLVVPGEKNPERPRYDLKSAWKAIRTAAELEGVRIHDLRRTYGLRVARDAGLHVASKLLRHSSVTITEKHYAPLGFGELKRATEKHARGLAKVLPLNKKAAG